MQRYATLCNVKKEKGRLLDVCSKSALLIGNSKNIMCHMYVTSNKSNRLATIESTDRVDWAISGTQVFVPTVCTAIRM